MKSIKICYREWLNRCHSKKLPPIAKITNTSTATNITVDALTSFIDPSCTVANSTYEWT